MSAVPRPAPASTRRPTARGAGPAAPALAGPALAGPKLAGPALAVLALAAGTTVALPAAPAAAHDRLERAEPAAGAQVDREPGQVQLVFDQPVGRRFCTVVVTARGGVDLAVGACQVLDSTVTQPLRPAGTAGVYTVAYRVVSADGHPVTGTSTFTVTTGPSAPVALGAPTPAGNAATTPTAAAPTTPEPRAAGVGTTAPRARAAAHSDHAHEHRHGLAGTGLALLAVAGLGAACWGVLRRRAAGDITATSGKDRP